MDAFHASPVDSYRDDSPVHARHSRHQAQKDNVAALATTGFRRRQSHVTELMRRIFLLSRAHRSKRAFSIADQNRSPQAAQHLLLLSHRARKHNEE